MKFTDGYWRIAPGVQAFYGSDVRFTFEQDNEVVSYVATRRIEKRGDTLNTPLITTKYRALAQGTIAVRIYHHEQERRMPVLLDTEAHSFDAGFTETDESLKLTAGEFSVTVPKSGEWNTEFRNSAGALITRSNKKSLGYMVVEDEGPFVHEQFELAPGELIYGLGERFGPLVKNGQSVVLWNEDGGTSSEQSYKNVPFFMSSAGYGVLITSPGKIHMEVGSEAVSKVRVAVAGEELEYVIMYGATPKDILAKLAEFLGKPPVVPAWSHGLWLTTSFTTNYDEDTVNSFVDGMAERDIPLSVFHFDCFWMREFHWVDFIWDPATFPDPEGMLARLKAKGLKICLWINPYIAQQSYLFQEGKANGYLVKRADGSVWQWDRWQSGMGLVDFTNPDAVAWFQGKLKVLMGQGVDSFKTDFGERIPTDVVWHDGSDPERMHNYYTHLYNKTVFDVLERERGEGDALVFARSATAGGQNFPVHWGGDSDSTFPSMAETVRGGLSLSMCGFGYWSHDIGGFENYPDPAVYKRWVAFGMLSSHSRLHGSTSYRVPWIIDDEAVDVTRFFTKFKISLMPYLYRQSLAVAQTGIPSMRSMYVEFPSDPATTYIDSQYMLGDDLLVAPVMNEDGVAKFYVPQGKWTSVLDDSVYEGGRWYSEEHGYLSVPALARPGSVIARSEGHENVEYDWAQGVTLHAYELPTDQETTVEVPRASGTLVTFTFTPSGAEFTVTSDDADIEFSVRFANRTVTAIAGTSDSDSGVVSSHAGRVIAHVVTQ